MNKRFRKHPLIYNLPDVLHSTYSYPLDFAWFPSNTVKPRALQGLHPTKLYTGAFQKWKSGWFPLIYTDDEKYPVMLAKTDGLGLWVISTMLLASANPRVLIENFILRAKSNYVQIKQYHSRYRLLRIGYALRAITILILTGATIYTTLALHILIVDIPYSSTAVGNIVISLLITFLAAITGKLLNYVLSSLRSAFNK